MTLAAKFLPFLPVFVFVVWSLFVYQFPPTEIAEYVGAQNGYLVTLLLSFIGGISIIVAVPYHLVMMTFAAGGLNPFFLGLVASLGQYCGDTTSYFLGYSGRTIASPDSFRWIERFLHWMTNRPYWQVAALLFVYGSVSPFSNDWLLIPMGLTGYPFWRITVPLGLGNTIFNIAAALIGAYGLASILGT